METERPNPVIRSYRRSLAWVRKYVPPGMRLALGLVVTVGGVFGFLPVLGFWMIPLGLTIAAMDIRPLWRRFKNR